MFKYNTNINRKVCDMMVIIATIFLKSIFRWRLFCQACPINAIIMSNPGIQIKMSNCLFKYYFSLKIYVAGVQKITVSKNVKHYIRTKKNVIDITLIMDKLRYNCIQKFHLVRYIVGYTVEIKFYGDTQE